MNTNSLKRIATAARTMLMHGVRSRLRAVGFDEDGTVRETPHAVDGGVMLGSALVADPHFLPRWEALRHRIEAHGVKNVVEEAAYTWFNRLMALRILTRNGLAPAVLDYVNPDIRLPRIVTDARAGKTPILSAEDRTALDRVILDGRLAFEQFSILIRAVCENNAIIRNCFGGITDYTALLLPADILAEGNFIDLLNDADSFISADEWRKPELIGWLYQFYISEKKDEVFAKKGGYDSDEIPAATQIFTPNWIVKYMVENTLGRIYLDNNPDSPLAENWKYLVEPAEPTPAEAVLRYSSLEELTCADLSCGSGHILNEMYDLLMQLYTDDFYSPREAIEAIFTKNMVGIDLDIRARQLAQFALLLKACQTDSAFANGHCMPRIYSFPEVNEYTWRDLNGHFNTAYSIVVSDASIYQQIDDAFKLMRDADALGSIMKFDLSASALDYIRKAVATFDAEPKFVENFTPLIDAFRIILALTDKYAAICMNPPYMPTNKEPRLKTLANREYPISKSDLFAIFMDVATDRLEDHGKYGMINMQSWMFLSSFEGLRKEIIDNQQIDSLLHLGPRTFDELSGEVVQNAAFVISNEKPSYPDIYYRLIDGKNCTEKRDMFLAGDNRYVIAEQKQFEQIPGAPIAYWVSESLLQTFDENNYIYNKSIARSGFSTGDNDRFIRYWFEIPFNDISMSLKEWDQYNDTKSKYIPFVSGGPFRRWYGNLSSVVNWSISSEMHRPRTTYSNLYLKPGVTWNAITSGNISSRAYQSGFLFEHAAASLFPLEGYDPQDFLGFINSNVFQYILKMLNPTLNNGAEVVSSIPFLDNNLKISSIVSDCISISKQDWDAHETSWDFAINPLLAVDTETYLGNIDWTIEKHRRKTGETLCIDPAAPELDSLRWRYQQYCEKWESLFDRLHRNEEELNRKFIEIYGLQDELKPNVPLKDVTILQQGEIVVSDKEEGIRNISNGDENITHFLPLITFNADVVIKQFISYAIGCMMGRYRLDQPGLAIAHPNPSEDEVAEYIVPETGEKWWIDDDGIVPMMGADSPFHDNAANRFSEFVRVTLGNDKHTDNMNFIRECLGKDVVDYLRNDFYTDHKRMYQNRPIYWMFSSNQKGKRAAFQCLVYMHRMDRFTPEHIRTNYLLPYIDHLAAREAELMAKPSLTTKESKELKQLRSDLEECRDYQLRLHAFADQQIAIDLDDGVVKNYATFAPVLAKLK